jgi:SUKH-3 immunity protein
MSDTELSPHSLLILRKSGWDSLPRNIERDLADLKYGEFDFPSDSVVFILKQYSGLEFNTVSEYQGCRLEICFGLDKALEVPCVKSDIAEHEIIIGKKLYPIGSVDSIELEEENSYERLILLMAEDGNIYSSRSYVISLQGYNINDYINRIIEDQPLCRSNKNLIINYSQRDPKLKELRKKKNW